MKEASTVGGHSVSEDELPGENLRFIGFIAAISATVETELRRRLEQSGTDLTGEDLRSMPPASLYDPGVSRDIYPAYNSRDVHGIFSHAGRDMAIHNVKTQMNLDRLREIAESGEAVRRIVCPLADSKVNAPP